MGLLSGCLWFAGKKVIQFAFQRIETAFQRIKKPYSPPHQLYFRPIQRFFDHGRP